MRERLLLVDTNVWLAAGDRSARQHEQCAEVLRSNVGRLASTVPVIAETAWLLLDRIGAGAQRGFLDMVAAEEVEAVGLDLADWRRVAELVGQYADLRLDVVDASTIAVAERLGQRTIATLDHRDFRTVRPAHVPGLDTAEGWVQWINDSLATASLLGTTSTVVGAATFNPVLAGAGLVTSTGAGIGQLVMDTPQIVAWVGDGIDGAVSAVRSSTSIVTAANAPAGPGTPL